MFSKIILNFVFLFSVLTGFAQTDTGKKVHTKLIKVNNNIYMLQGNGGNIGLSFGKDGIFMVDSQYAEGFEQIREDIKKVSDAPIRFLVNTHFHNDHIGGNDSLANTGTVIISHENTRSRIHDVIKSEKKKMSEDGLPMITFSEDLTLFFNGEKIYTFHLPNAHTDGDAMIYFSKSNILHTGDILFNGKYPFIDLENGGSLKGTIDGIQRALSRINTETKIIPGHGDLASYKDLENTAGMLSTIYKQVAQAYINNKTEADIVKMTDLTKEFDAQGYGSGFINREAFLKMVYKSVAEDRKGIESNNEKNKEARDKIEQMKKEYERKNKN